MYPQAKDRHGSKSISFVMYKGCIIASDDILHFMGQDKLYIILLSDLLSADYFGKNVIFLKYFWNFLSIVAKLSAYTISCYEIIHIDDSKVLRKVSMVYIKCVKN